MMATDVLLILVAAMATALIILRRAELKEVGALSGMICVLSGLWGIAGIYIADFYIMTVMPVFYGTDTAMQVMADLHMYYSWFVFAASALLVLAGLVQMVFRLSRQARISRSRNNELRENESILDSIFQNLPVGLLIKDKNHIVERPNRTYVAWYGNDVEKMLGHTSDYVENFQPKEDAGVMNAQEDEVLETGRILQRQVVRTFADGKQHTVHITKFPIYDREGRIIKVGSISVDLSEQVQAEEAARSALEEAEKANRAKSKFIATMSHEFRTPLNAILGFSEMLRREYFGPLGSDTYKGYADDIHDSGVHLLGLVNDILDIATIEAGKRVINKEVIRLVDVVDDCIRHVAQSADEGKLHLVLNLPDALPTLLADRKTVTQILINLLSNAIKFTEPGGTITISAEADATSLTLSVADAGKGIAEDVLPNITEPFSKSQSNPHVSEAGTGLGLSIVKSLVEMHGGKLRIESAIDAGTTIWITLPR